MGYQARLARPVQGIAFVLAILLGAPYEYAEAQVAAEAPPETPPDDGDAWQRIFFEAGYSLGAATVGRDMEADALPAGFVPGTDPQTDSDLSNNSLIIGNSNRCDLAADEYCVRVTEGLFALVHSLHLGVGAYITDRFGLSLRLRYAPIAGEGTLSNIAFGVRAHYRVVVPRVEGLHLGAFAGVSVGQYQVRPIQRVPPGGTTIYRPYVQTGLVGLEVGANIGYRFHPNVGVFVQPSWYIQLPSVSSGLQLTVGLDFALGRVDVNAPHEYEADEPTLPDDPDRDGIRDDIDRCPTELEDFDGFEDEDGCPDLDNDGDGAPDVQDACPRDAEDMDSFEDSDGCPERDNDGDGVFDADDRCPSAEGPGHSQGCPADDTDRDGIVDRFDNCPNEAGTPENYGCRQEQLVQIQEGRLTIYQTIYFRTNSDRIQPRSFELLDQVGAVLNAHPEIRRIRVEGHTDERGSLTRNQRLSTTRAASVVRYLTREAGVDGARLESIGYGESAPVHPNASNADEHAANRRVEFRILE